MTDPDSFLQGIVEAEETSVGSKPRRTTKKDDHTPHKPGRGPKKTAVIGAVERDGVVIAKVAEDLKRVPAPPISYKLVSSQQRGRRLSCLQNVILALSIAVTLVFSAALASGEALVRKADNEVWID